MAIYKDVSSLELVTYTVPKDGTFADGVDFILEKLDTIPEADVEPVKHARWITSVFDEKWGGKESECSNCKNLFPYWKGDLQIGVMPYCPKCGAKMDGKEESEHGT